MSQHAVAKISFAFELVEKRPNPKHSLGAERVFISRGNKGNELFEISQTVFDILSVRAGAGVGKVGRDALEGGILQNKIPLILGLVL